MRALFAPFALLALAACGPTAATPPAPPAPPAPARQLVEIPGATFTVGDPAHTERRPDETPRRVTVESFRIMRFEVTNDQFAAFIAATGHVTDPETKGWGWVWTRRGGRYGWVKTRGASWRHPYGPGSEREGGAYPVVQISHRDAAALCAHLGMRLPTEEEWELAAGGPRFRRFPWGDQPPRQGEGLARANFGTEDCCAPSRADGSWRAAPVGSYPGGASPYGLLDAAGNVWEWTDGEFPGRPGRVTLRGGGWGNNPFCLRVAYRHSNPPDIGRDMVGVRCAMDAP